MKSLSNTVIAAIIALTLTFIVGLFVYLPLGHGLEAWMGDKMLTWRYDLLKKTHPDRKPDPHLVLAAIDQPSVEDLGRWPFPRSIHGQFLQVLAPEKPKTVAWDIFFTERTAASPATTPAAPPHAPSPAPAAADTSTTASTASSSQLESDDQSLVDGARLFSNMVTAAARDRSSGLSLKDDDILPTQALKNVSGDISKLISAPYAVIPFPELRKVSYFGFADVDANDLRRTVPLVINIHGKIFPSFDLQALMQYWRVDSDQTTVVIGHEITLPRPDGSQAHIPINDSGQFIVNYRARTEDFQALGYSKMGKGLSDKIDNQTSPERDHLPAIKDNIVIVGVTLDGVDDGPIPINSYSPLVIAHLNVLNNILQQDYLHYVNAWIWMPLYALVLFGLTNVMLRMGIVPMISLALASILLLAGVAFSALCLGNLLIPIAMPTIGLLLLSIAVPSKGFFGEEREKTRIKSAMRAYLSEKVMNKVLEHPDNVKLGGVKQEITVMFCDIRGFTKYCDERDPQEVLNVINDYFEEMTQVVFKYDGTVDKYIGDCIMAFWNAPEAQADHAQRAVCCAMEMRYALANFKTKRAGIDSELFECGIGIHTGEALVGNMGSSLKLNYTAMGSTVNMGARLEALTKRLNERILISQDVLNQLQGDFPITDRGEAIIPGFAKPIHVYAVGADQDISAALNVGRTLAGQQEYTAEEAVQPIWQPAPLPEDADPNS
jgi:adenylate cyclase